MKKIRKLLSVLLIGLLILSLTACQPGVKSSDNGVKVFKLGVNGTDFRIWEDLSKRLEEHNIKLEIISFADYIKPNQALADGEIDLNAFQTKVYFEQFIADHNLKLSQLNYTILAPMGVYSDKIKDISEVKDKDKVGIPNDATNGGRALMLLETAGLIKLDETNTVTPTVKNIIENPKNLEIIEMAAAQLPRSLEDLDFAVINNGVAIDAGMTLNDDAIYAESTEGENVSNYFNIIAVRTEDLEKPEIQKIKEIYLKDETKKVIDEVYKGSAMPAF